MRLASIAFICLAGLSACDLAQAACDVTNLEDSGPGSLRQAILEANAASGGDIGIRATGVIKLESPLPVFEENIQLFGPGAENLIIDANTQPKVFQVAQGSASLIVGLTISNALEIVPFLQTGGGGAAIENEGSLNLQDCLITDCVVGSMGGGTGGAIRNWGQMEIGGCVVANSGAVYDPVLYHVAGGGVGNHGTMLITDTLVTGCLGYYGGGIFNQGSLTIRSSTIESCYAAPQADGGAILNLADLVLDTCVISNNYGFYAGGVASYQMSLGEAKTATLSGRNCLITDNSSYDLGGGLLLHGKNDFMGCSIIGNSGGVGGGVLNVGKSQFVNCTLSGNTSFGSGNAAQGWVFGVTSELEFDHCTIVSNYSRAMSQGAGIGSMEGSVVRVGNCIIAWNGERNVAGKLISLGHNLFGDGKPTVTKQKTRGDLFGLDPRLGPLQYNGGFTPTHAILPGSPAIDAGFANGLKEDQRGYPRKRNLPEMHNNGDGSDIGAYEYGAETRGSRGNGRKDKEPPSRR